MTGAEQRLYLLYAVMAFAREYVDYKPVHYVFFGDNAYFAP